MPFAIGLRVSTWKTSANRDASLPVTTSSVPRTSWNTFSRCSRLSVRAECGKRQKGVELRFVLIFLLGASRHDNPAGADIQTDGLGSFLFRFTH